MRNILIPIILLCFLHSNTCMAQKEKNGILLVAFGTTVPKAKIALDNFDKIFKAAFPNTEIRWAYSSKFIRKKLRKQGFEIDSPIEALAKMGEDGFKTVYVQSLHTIPGSEYNDLIKTVDAFQNMPKGVQKVKSSTPLLYNHHDMEECSKALLSNLPKERKAKEAVILMGHGTHHPANIYYPGLQYYLWKHDKNVFVGTVEGSPELSDILETLKEKNIKKIWLMPFMAVAGDHAINDMAGKEEDSWKSILEKENFKVECYLKGTGEINDIAKLWVKHLKEIMK